MFDIDGWKFYNAVTDTTSQKLSGKGWCRDFPEGLLAVTKATNKNKQTTSILLANWNRWTQKKYKINYKEQHDDGAYYEIICS